MKRYAPQIAELAGELVRYGLTEWARSRAPLQAVRVQPNQKGCPYCRVAQHLSVAALCFDRLTRHPDQRRYYRPLSRVALASASDEAFEIPTNPGSAELLNQVSALHDLADHPEVWNQTDTDSMRDRCLKVAHLALDLAEQPTGGPDGR